MAKRFTGNSDFLSDAAHPIDYNQPYTVAFWKRINGNNAYGHAWALSFDGTEQSGDYTSSDHLGVAADGVTFRGGVSNSNGGGGDFPEGSTLSIGDWNFVAARRSSATLWEALLNGVVDFSSTNDITGRQAIGGEYMGRFNGGYFFDGDVALFMAWQAALTDAEIRAQMRAAFPLRIANLHRFTPMFPTSGAESLRDVIRGWGWTSNGSPTEVANPSLPLHGIKPRRVFMGSTVPVGSGTPSTSVATASGTGIAAHQGTGAPAVGVATASGAGRDAYQRGTGAPATSIATASGAGIAARSGSGTPSTSVAVAAGSGLASHAGAGAPSTTLSTADGTGVSAHAGSGAPSTSLATASGAGVAAHVGSGAAGTSTVTADGAGTRTGNGGSGSPSTAVATASGSGIATHAGTGSPATSAPSAAGSGVAAHTGSGTPSTSILTASGAGVAGSAPVGSGAPSTSVPTASGSGVASHVGAGTPSTSIATAEGTGRDSYQRGSGAPGTSVATAAGAGIASHGGAGAPSTSLATAAGTGTRGGGGTATGTGSATVPHVTASGVGVVVGVYVAIEESLDDLTAAVDRNTATLELVLSKLDSQDRLLRAMLSDNNMLWIKQQKMNKERGR